MGASPSIDEQAKHDEAFQKYINERNAELDKTAATAKTQMEDRIKSFYNEGGWTDAKPITSGSYQHLSTISSWSLDHVTAMIDAVRASLFGGPSAPKPDSSVPNPKSVTGNENAELDPKTKSVLGLMGGTELIIANAAFCAISGILSQLKSSTETELSKNIKQKDLLPGLSLFVCVMENKYHRKDFFSDEMIVQNFYIYDCRMSVTRAADIAKFDRIQGLIAQQLDLESGAEEISSQIKNLKFSDYKKDRTIIEATKAYKADVSALSDMVEDYNQKIQAIAKRVDELRSLRMRASVLAIAEKRRELLTL